MRFFMQNLQINCSTQYFSICFNMLHIFNMYVYLIDFYLQNYVFQNEQSQQGITKSIPKRLAQDSVSTKCIADDDATN